MSCKHQGEKDVRRHIEGKKHRDTVQTHETQPPIGTFFGPVSHPIHEKVTRAEVKVSTVLAHHDIPIALTDNLSPVFLDIFPASEITKMCCCAHTKTTCIVNGALSLVEHMKAEPFSLATDGSTIPVCKRLIPLLYVYMM